MSTKALKTNPKQFEVMVQFMEQNRDLATNKLSSCHYKSKSNALWNDLMTQLNAEGPPTRNSDVWKKVWKDVKYYASTKLSFNTQGKNKTGGGVFKPKIITELEERIICICKLKSRADGISGSKSFGLEMNLTTISQCEIGNMSFGTIPNFEESDDMDIFQPVENISENYDMGSPINEIEDTPTVSSRRNRPNKSNDSNLLKKQIDNQSEFNKDFKIYNTDKTRILKDIRNELKLLRKLKEKEISEKLKNKQRKEKRAEEMHNIKLQIKELELQNLMTN